MTPLRQHMITALQLSGKGERTQQAYVREVRLLAQFYHKSPDRISEQELQHYFLHRKNVDGLAPASMRLCYSGIRFFYQHVLQRDWHTLTLMRAQTAHRLPAVLSVEEVMRLLASATPFHNQVYFTTVYSLGLRHEALSLQVSDIDGPRLQVHIHRGKSAKDRSVPLPADTLDLRRTYWKTHRNTTWLFPATGRDQLQSPTATSPMSRTSVQGAFRIAKHRAGITKLGVAIHTLRHSYATHLLEVGFLHTSCAIPTVTLRQLLMQAHPIDFKPMQKSPPPPLAACGPTCGAPMRVVMRLWAAHKAFVDTG